MTAQYGIWLMPAAPDGVLLQELIDGLSKTAKTYRFIPHLKLIGPVALPLGKLAGLRDITKGLSYRASSISTELTGVGMLNLFFQALFLHVQPMDQLLNFNRYFREMMNHDDDPPFMPHISMLYASLTYATKRNLAHSIMEKMVFPFNVHFDHLAMVNLNDSPEKWKIEEEFPLGD